jgi:hypothetical protein
MVFPGLKVPIAIGRLFSMDLDSRLMFVEHQSTSDAKIENAGSLTRAGMLNFWYIDFTDLFVKHTE